MIENEAEVEKTDPTTPPVIDDERARRRDAFLHAFELRRTKAAKTGGRRILPPRGTP